MKACSIVMMLALLCTVGSAASIRGSRAAFRQGKRVALTVEPEEVGMDTDESGNENVEIIKTSKDDTVKPGCADVDCATRFDDGGKFAAAVESARSEVGEAYHHETQSAPVVLTEGFCAKVLHAFKNKAEPYWNSEKMMCNTEREHVMAQCETRTPGFIDKVSALCPNANTAELEQGDPEFKKVTYVGDIPKEFTGEPGVEEAPCAEGQHPCPKLKNTEDGLPVDEWAAFPNAPSAEVDARVVRRQQMGVRDSGMDNAKELEVAA